MVKLLYFFTNFRLKIVFLTEIFFFNVTSSLAIYFFRNDYVFLLNLK